MPENILDEQYLDELKLHRRALLPIWIKVFIWIFLLLAGIIPLILIANLFGVHVDLALYGLETDQVFSLSGMLIMILFAYKGVIAYGMWTEKDWAINAAFPDAILGIVICLLLMLFPEWHPNEEFVIRLELIILLPYLIKLINLQEPWSMGIAQGK